MEYVIGILLLLPLVALIVYGLTLWFGGGDG